MQASASAVGLLCLGFFLQTWVARAALPWGYVLWGLWPHVTRATLPATVALLGAAAFPHHAYSLSTMLHRVSSTSMNCVYVLRLLQVRGVGCRSCLCVGERPPTYASFTESLMPCANCFQNSTVIGSGCLCLVQAIHRSEREHAQGSSKSTDQDLLQEPHTQELEADRLASRAAAGRTAWLSALRGQGLGLVASLLVFLATLTVSPLDGLRMTLADGPKLLSEVLSCALAVLRLLTGKRLSEYCLVPTVRHGTL